MIFGYNMLNRTVIGLVLILNSSLCFGQHGSASGRLARSPVSSSSLNRSGSVRLQYEILPQAEQHRCIYITTSNPKASFRLIVECGPKAEELGDFQLYCSPDGCLSRVSLSIVSNAESNPTKADLFVQNEKGEKVSAKLKINDFFYELDNEAIYLLRSSNVSVLNFKPKNAESLDSLIKDDENADGERKKVRDLFSEKLTDLSKGNCSISELSKAPWVPQPFVDRVVEDHKQRWLFLFDDEQQEDYENNENKNSSLEADGAETRGGH